MARTLRTKRHKAMMAVLRASRTEKGLTQRQLAEKLGRAENFVNKVETGERRLDLIEFFQLAEGLGVDPIVLFTRIANW
jgi:transcriptional regulator with XRE-family HTH domain